MHVRLFAERTAGNQQGHVNHVGTFVAASVFERNAFYSHYVSAVVFAVYVVVFRETILVRIDTRIERLFAKRQKISVSFHPYRGSFGSTSKTRRSSFRQRGNYVSGLALCERKQE